MIYYELGLYKVCALYLIVGSILTFRIFNKGLMRHNRILDKAVVFTGMSVLWVFLLVRDIADGLTERRLL